MLLRRLKLFVWYVFRSTCRKGHTCSASYTWHLSQWCSFLNVVIVLTKISFSVKNGICEHQKSCSDISSVVCRGASVIRTNLPLRTPEYDQKVIGTFAVRSMLSISVADAPKPLSVRGITSGDFLYAKATVFSAVIGDNWRFIRANFIPIMVGIKWGGA